MCLEKNPGSFYQKDLLNVAGITRQGYHQHWQRVDKKQEEFEHKVQLVRVIRAQWQYCKMGSRSLYFALDISCMGINRFERLLSENGLTVKSRKFKVRTTYSTHDEMDVNHVKGLEIRDINRVLVGDFTYFFAEKQLYYIFCLKDAYSKRTVGLYGSETMRGSDAGCCLTQAEKLRGKKALSGCIHHTDGGTQYKSREYRSLASYLTWSIADGCLENGMAEQLNFIIKNHYLQNETIRNVEQLNRFLQKIKEFINEMRPVKALGYKTPVQFENEIKDIALEDRMVFRFSSFENRQKGGL